MSAVWMTGGLVWTPGARGGVVECDVRNDSGERWSAAEGFAFSYQVYDAAAATVIADGARQVPEGDVAPGGTAHVRIAVEFPPEDGCYYALIGPMREGVCWYSGRGWPFLMVECRVESGVADVTAPRVSTAAALRRKRAIRSVGRAFTLPLQSVWANRGLIRVMVRRDILGRYRGSFAGAFWTVINPLLLMLTYFFVFGMVLRTRFGPSGSRSEFALYFLAGMLPWLAFSEALGRAPVVMLEHRNFVKKLVFAVETLPVNLVVAGLVSEAFAVALYCVFLWVVRGSVPGALVWLPMLILPQVLLTAGLVWFLAALGVFMRDLGQIMGFVLTMWFFITPICYPEASLPPSATLVLSKNPLFVLVRGYRDIFLENRMPALGPVWKLWLVAVVVFVLGHAWFYRLRKSFADLL
jgi:lipopolysaccharide transport system permease protein